MSSHYLGTAEIRIIPSDDLVGIVHRFAVTGGYTEYWMVRLQFHLWENGQTFTYRFVEVPGNPGNDKLGTFKAYGLAEFQKINVGPTGLRLWNHAIQAVTLP